MDIIKPSEVCSPSCVGEGFKGWIHMALFTCTVVCAAYNASQVGRQQRTQAVVYAALALWEATQVKGHWNCQ